jgi:tRNA (guanosine-2'-O-)-methyltransferase
VCGASPSLLNLENLDPHVEDALIEHLLQFVTPEKKARMEQVVANRTDHIRVVLEDIYQPHNASAVMRSCECFGVQHLHVIENKNEYVLNRDVAMGSTNWINLHRHRAENTENTSECLLALRSAGYRIVATSLDPGSIPLTELPLENKTSLWFGTEEHGLTQQVLDAADAHVHIPMLGFTQSFNISVSAAICLYEMRSRMQKEGIPSDLSPSEKREVYRLWLNHSVKNCEIIARSFLRDAIS